MEPEGGSRDGEARLLELARSGNGDAFDQLVALNQDRIYGLLARLVGREEAEDLAQECFLRAWRALATFRGGAAFHTWLYRIALNLARSEGRSRKRRREFEVPAAALAAVREGPEGPEGAEMDCDGFEMPAVEARPEHAAEARERSELVQAALAGLSAENREVVVLRDVEGLDYDQIAPLVGASREAIKSRLHRARGELARQLRRMGCEL